MTEHEVINQFMEDSAMYGFQIKRKDGRYYCTTKCSHCDTILTQKVYPHVKSINGEQKVQCVLPVYCDLCISRGKERGVR